MAFPTPPTLQKHTKVMELALPGNNSHLHMWKMDNELKTEDTEDYDDGENDPLTSNDQATEEKCAHEVNCPRSESPFAPFEHQMNG